MKARRKEKKIKEKITLARATQHGTVDLMRQGREKEKEKHEDTGEIEQPRKEAKEADYIVRTRRIRIDLVSLLSC